jgi:hypothetical protein
MVQMYTPGPNVKVRTRWPGGRRPKTRCWRPGPWLFAAHPFFTWRPRACVYPGRGWSVWWLWFEIARVR